MNQGGVSWVFRVREPAVPRRAGYAPTRTQLLQNGVRKPSWAPTDRFCRSSGARMRWEPRSGAGRIRPPPRGRNSCKPGVLTPV
ncbi:hypothetical protein GCM10009862_05290 [Microbacterium binotii]|uniref:Uncharacterized protein n=1 Tax=Microbacterium binotii TaxID=462710 RepID=A0ABN3P7W0_9MICO